MGVPNWGAATSLLLLLLLGAPFAQADGLASEVTPMEKVIELLANLKQKVEEEGVTEAQNYKEFIKWCSDEALQCKTTIANCEGKITELRAQIEYEISTQQRLEAEIASVVADISGKEAELQDATNVRAKEHEDFLTADMGFMEGINTFNSAIEVLQRKPDEQTLLQLANRLSGTLQQQAAMAGAVSEDKMQRFFETVGRQQQSPAPAPQPDLVQTGSEAHGRRQQQPVYDSRAGELISLLSQMRGDIEDQRTAGQKEEDEKTRTFELLKQSCELELKNMNAVLADKKSQGAASSERQSAQEGEISEVSTLMADTQQYEQETEIACQEKEAENEERQKSRNEELGAIGEATRILTSDRASEVNQRGPGAAPLPKGAGFFLQLGSSSSSSRAGVAIRRHQPAQKKLVPPEERLRRALSLLRPEYRAPLEAAARASGVKALPFAADVGAHPQQPLSFLQQRSANDPFEKVKHMIESMVEKLMEEAADAAEHKAWCDKEQADARKQGVHFERREEKLQSRIKETKAEVELHQDEIRRLSQTIQDMDAGAAEATKIRQEENKAATAALKDYGDGQAMLQKAVQVLSDFYERKAAAESALLQRQKAARQEAVLQEGVYDSRAAGPPPKTFGNHGAENRKAAAAGILNILEIALSDFARMQSETQTEEATAQREYDAYMQTYKVQKAVAEQEVKNHEESQKKAEGAVATQQKDLAEVQTELKAVYEYEEKLKVKCDFSGPSFEERQTRRQQDIQAMQNALAILSGDAIA